MKQVKQTGGGNIGYANATWPFVTLTVTSDKFELKASILGYYVFKPGDIISLEPYSGFLRSGMKINHCVQNYPQEIIFWTSNPEHLIGQIRQLGFFNNVTASGGGANEQISVKQSQGGFPIKIPVAVGIVVIWNIFFFIDFKDFFIDKTSDFPVGLGAKLGLGFIFMTCALTLLLKPFANLVLKKGRTINDLKPFIFFIMFICGMMLLMTSLH